MQKKSLQQNIPLLFYNFIVVFISTNVKNCSLYKH